MTSLGAVRQEGVRHLITFRPRREYVEPARPETHVPGPAEARRSTPTRAPPRGWPHLLQRGATRWGGLLSTDQVWPLAVSKISAAATTPAQAAAPGSELFTASLQWDLTCSERGISPDHAAITRRPRRRRHRLNRVSLRHLVGPDDLVPRRSLASSEGGQ